MRLLVIALALAALLPLASAGAQGSIPDVHYLRFNEGTGLATADDAIPGVSALPTLGGAATWDLANPRLGAAALISGAGANDNVTVNVPFALTGSWTLELWLYDYSLPTNTTLRYVLGENTTAFRLFAGGVAGSNNLILRGTGVTDTLIAGGAQQNVWVHAAFVYDATAGTITPYLNGTAQTPVVQTGVPSFAATTLPGLRIGGYGGNVNGYTGAIDEFRIWNTARTPTDIATFMGTELVSTSVDRINVAAPYPAITFNTQNSTFSVVGSVASYVNAYGLEVTNSAIDPLAAASFSITGSFAGSDTQGLSNVVLTPCTTNLVVSPGTDELQIITLMSIGFGAGDIYRFGGNLGAFPTIHRALGQSGAATVTRTGAGSSGLDALSTAFSGGDTLTLIVALEATGPVLRAFVRNYVLPAPAAASAFVTDGFGSAEIGVIGVPAATLLFHLAAFNVGGTAGTGPLFGLPFGTDQMVQIAAPHPSEPIKAVADVNGNYFWGTPSGIIPLGTVVDLAALSAPPGATSVTPLASVVRLTF